MSSCQWPEKEGLRIFTTYGFHAVQAYDLRKMPGALARAWVEACGTPDEAFYGGAYGVESVIRGLQEARKSEE